MSWLLERDFFFFFNGENMGDSIFLGGIIFHNLQKVLVATFSKEQALPIFTKYLFLKIKTTVIIAITAIKMFTQFSTCCLNSYCMTIPLVAS